MRNYPQCNNTMIQYDMKFSAEDYSLEADGILNLYFICHCLFLIPLETH